VNLCNDIKIEYSKNDYKGIIVCGPTCSGKSSIALELCQELNGELISCDSMQIYKYMDIGTAKPTKEEQKKVPHHMIDIVNPWVNYNAFQYKEDAEKVINDVVSRKKTPVICGGTGLYVNSIIDNRKYTETCEEESFCDFEISNKINKMFDGDDRDGLYSWLSEVDNDAAITIHKNNVKRVKRFLELFYITGKVKSVRDSESKEAEIKNEYLTVCLWPNREKLYEKIDRRVDIMREAGLFEECKKVYELCRKNVSNELINGGKILTMTSLAAIGYRELLPLLDYVETRKLLEEKEGYGIDKAFDEIKLNTRHYAKRQMTWFKKTPGTVFFTEEGICTKIQ